MARSSRRVAAAAAAAAASASAAAASASAASASAEAEDEVESRSRRSTRTRKQTVLFTQHRESGVDSPQDDDMYDSNASSEEEEEEKPAAAPTRKSSRSTKFSGAMKDPSNSIADLLKKSGDLDGATKKRKSTRVHKKSSLEASGSDEEESDYESDAPKSKRRSSRSTTTPKKSSGKNGLVKSPAKRHTKKRMTKRLEFPESDEEDDSSEEEDEDEDEDSGVEEDDNEDMKIHRIIAARSLTIKEWKEICSKMNTTEITNGSRWVQEEDTRDPEKYEERFLVKWHNLSFLHCSWETEKDLVEFIENAKTHLNSFFRKSVNGLLYDADERMDGDYFDPSWVQVDRILEVEEEEKKGRRKSSNDDPVEKYNIILDVNHPDFESGTGRQFFVKWANTPYSLSTYEFERDLILNEIDYLDQLKLYERRSVKPSKDDMKKLFKKSDNAVKQLYTLFGDKMQIDEEKVKEYQDKLAAHVFSNGGQLRDYQAEGVSWLMSNYINRRSSILADEMGLGKTCQTATFCSTVSSQLSKRGPFLIVAPLSTIPHWYREFTGWTDLNTIVYHGSANDRERTREDEFAFPNDRPANIGFNQKYLNKVQKSWKNKWERTWMVEVVITTPEMLVTDDFAELGSVEWEILVVDEAHRLKNHNSKLAVNLRDTRFIFHHTLLLTGTPIQNNMQELWTLLNFIDPENFVSLDRFMAKYGDIKSKERVDELHETIRPFILRRLKEDVEKSVPPKEETLIEVELTVLQKQYYRALYEKNLKFLHRNKKKALDGPSLNNLAMQLRKCCNHPFLLKGVEDEVKKQQPGVSIVDSLVNASGKFVLLDKLLPRLQQDGHRILLFSQFKIMLDIIEDYLHLRQFKCERIDGSITGLKRQAAIDRFQSNESDGRESPFIMLLSTRAGGVGINLTAADTVIIFDSDWNPQNDLQAQARCHRIGQTKNVKIYRLLASRTYEMQMFHMSSMKMGLDQAVLQGIENTGGSKDIMTKEEVEQLLKHGAYSIFSEDKDGTSEKESNDFISQDIDSILERRAKTVIHENTGSKSSAKGGTFSKASFKNTTSDGVAAADIDVDDPDFWTKVVGVVKEEEDKNDLAGKKRKRTKTNYSEQESWRDINAKIREGIDSDDDDKYGDDASAASEYNDTGDVSDDESLDNEALKKILKATKAKRNERYLWGGSLPNEWMQPDAEQVLKALQSFGYSNVSFDKFLSSMSLSRPYSDDEMKRMSWSIPLTALQEAAEDDVLESVAKGTEGTRDSLNQSISGKAENDPGSAGMEKGEPEDRLQQSFHKLLVANEAWAKKALADARAYSASATPRDKSYVESILSGLHSPKNASKENVVFLKLCTAFNENVWPALRSRGWKDGSSDGKHNSYTYNGKTFKSISAVLDAIPKHHPELMNMVNSLIVSISASCDKSEDDLASSLNFGTLTAQSLKGFLQNYAPLQLLADRIRPHRMGLSKRLLPQLVLLHGLHTMVSTADANVSLDSSLEDRTMQLSKLIKVHAGTALPHAEWTTLHDAILIRATAKHGWLDRQVCCNSIAEDKSIKWGPPFEPPTELDEVKEGVTASVGKSDDVTKDQLLKVASRAASFLNKNMKLVDECRGIQASYLVRSFCLTQCAAEDEDESSVIWRVDKEALKANSGSDTCEELPSRKHLLRRAKKIVMSFIGQSHHEEEKEDHTKEKMTTITSVSSNNYGFGVLDQDCSSNVFLAELLRGLLKVSQKQKIEQTLSRVIFQEIDSRLEDMEKSGASADAMKLMKKIKQDVKLYLSHCAKSSRMSKNVLRVILGIDPVPSKSASGPLFPNETEKKDRVKPVAAIAQAALTKVKKKGLTPSDTALNRALASLRDIANHKDNGRSEDLRLTATEVLMLTVLSSQGLPTYCEDWMSAIDSDTMVDEDIGIDSFQIYFFAMGAVMKAAAEVWLEIAKKKLREKVLLLKSYVSTSDPGVEKLKDEVAVLEKDRNVKQLTLNDSSFFKAHPLVFAKKAVMLLEAVRKCMGPVDLNYVGEKKIKALNRSENGLGSKVLNWFSKEIQRWAGPLDIVDKCGIVLAETSISAVRDHPQSHDAALMTKRDCRTVFIQIAQQSRLRSIFIKNESSRLSRELIPKALKHLPDSDWNDCPDWWNKSDEGNACCTCQDDLDLLVGILDYGYGGFDCMLKHDFSFCARVKAEKRDDSIAFTRASAQARINQLTRELHQLDDSEEMMKLVQSRTSKINQGAEKCLGSKGEKNLGRKSVGGVQSGIQAFFKRSSGHAPPNSKQQRTPPTSPDNSDVEVIRVVEESENEQNASNKRKMDDSRVMESNKKQK